MARPKPQRTIDERMSYGIQYIHLSVPSGHRFLKTFKPINARIGKDGHVFATAELYGKIYKCRMMTRIPAWRICDEKGDFVTVHFPEGQEDYERQAARRMTAPWGESAVAAPYIWEDDAKALES